MPISTSVWGCGYYLVYFDIHTHSTISSLNHNNSKKGSHVHDVDFSTCSIFKRAASSLTSQLHSPLDVARSCKRGFLFPF